MARGGGAEGGGVNSVAGHPPFWLLSFFYFYFYFLGLWRLLSYMPMYLNSCVVIELVVLSDWIVESKFCFCVQHLPNIRSTFVERMLVKC